MSLITTPTHKDADSYAILTEADSYFEDFGFNIDGDRRDFWDEFSDAVKERALKAATKIVDRFRFFNKKYYNKQALEFPRKNCKTVSGNVDSGAVGWFIDSLLIDQDDYLDNYFKYWCVEITEGTNEWEKRYVTEFSQTEGKVTVDSSFSDNLDTSSQYKLIEKVPDAIKHAQCEVAYWLLKGRDREGRAKLQKEGVKSFRIGDFGETFEGMKNIHIPKEAEELLGKYISKIGHFE